jgi:hypothetical protein
MCLRVSYKTKYEEFFFFGIPEVLKKRVAPRANLHQNVTDPQHDVYSCNIVKSDFY